jgi:hypothetical protein
MKDIINKKCIECNDTRASPKYRGHCLRCFIYKFPTERLETVSHFIPFCIFLLRLYKNKKMIFYFNKDV